MKPFMISLFASSAVLLSGCQLTSKTTENQRMTADQNRALSTTHAPCVQPTLPSAKSAPPALYTAMVQCARQGDYQQAAVMYALAGTYSWFDATIINTRYARELHSDLVKTYFRALSSEQQKNLGMQIKLAMETPEKKQRICQTVHAAGVPQYRPTYMLLNSVGDHEKNSHKPAVFDQALARYLYCDPLF